MGLIYLFIILTGLALGSFMGVIVFRLDTKGGIWTGRSECAKCLKGLKWYDLVPVFSYISLRGRCRYCGHKLSVIYPLMEISVAVFLLLYFVFNGFFPVLPALYGAITIFLLLSLVFFDYLYLILPDKIIATALGVSSLYFIFFSPDRIIPGILTGLGLLSVFGIIYLVSRGEWMGFGDVKLVFLIGMVLGFPLGIISIICSVWLGALWGIGMIFTGKASLKTALPFGSFICVTAILFIIFNDYIEYILKGI